MAKEKRGIRDSVGRSIESSGLARGTITNAVITGFTRLLFFVLIPAWIMGSFIAIAQNDLSPSAPLFIEAATQIRTYMVAFGIPIALVAGLWAYHLRYSKARMYFGLLGSALLVVYGAAILLTPAMQDALSVLGWIFPVWIAFGLVCYRATRIALHFIRDYEFFQERAKKAADKEEKKTPFKPHLGRGEFSLKLGNISLGAQNAERFIKNTVTRFPFWLMIIVFFLSIFGFGDTPSTDRFLSVLIVMGYLFILVGIPASILAFFVGFFPKGTISRTACDLANSILFILLIYWIFLASGLPDVITDSGLIISLTPLILAILIWAAVDLIRVGAEYRDERRTWLKGVGYDVPPRKRKYFQIPPESKWYDFNPSIGKFSRGTIDAKKEVFRFVTMPELLILLIIGGLRSAQATGTLYGILQSWTVSILVFGLLIALVAFFRGYFPPGTYSRLLIGLLTVPALFLYVRGLALGGTLDEALKQVGLVIPMEEINLLVLIIIMFVGVMQFAEFGDARRSWRIAVGKKVKPYKTIKKMSRRHEFRVRFASKRQGIIWLRKGMVRYVYYTSIFIIILLTLIYSAAFAATGVDFSFLANRLSSIFFTLILIAIPLAASRAFYGFYPSGSTSKLLFGFVMAAAGAAYTYSCFSGGQIAIMGQWENAQAGAAIDFTFVVVMFFIGWGIWCAVVLVEYMSYRKDWIANDYRPVEASEVQERLQLERLISKEERRVTRLDEKARKRAARRAKRKGTSVHEEEEREVAAKEAEIKIAEVDEEEAEAEDKEEVEEPVEEKDEVEEELEEELGTKTLDEHKEQVVVPGKQAPQEPAPAEEEPGPEPKEKE